MNEDLPSRTGRNKTYKLAYTDRYLLAQIIYGTCQFCL